MVKEKRVKKKGGGEGENSKATTTAPDTALLISRAHLYLIYSLDLLPCLRCPGWKETQPSLLTAG